MNYEKKSGKIENFCRSAKRKGEICGKGAFVKAPFPAEKEKGRKNTKENL